MASVAVELGLDRETLRSWVRRTEFETASVAAGGLARRIAEPPLPIRLRALLAGACG
jgi:transposase-like protein